MQKVIEAGIIEGFLYVFEKRVLNLITETITTAFYSLTNASNEIALLMFAKNPFPGLLRLLEHTDRFVVDDGIFSIYNILLSGTYTTPDNSPHPHYEAMLKYGGIEKIF
jgi:hypothetical protein